MVLHFDCRSKIWGSIPPYLLKQLKLCFLRMDSLFKTLPCHGLAEMSFYKECFVWARLLPRLHLYSVNPQIASKACGLPHSVQSTKYNHFKYYRLTYFSGFCSTPMQGSTAQHTPLYALFVMLYPWLRNQG